MKKGNFMSFFKIFSSILLEFSKEILYFFKDNLLLKKFGLREIKLLKLTKIKKPTLSKPINFMLNLCSLKCIKSIKHTASLSNCSIHLTFSGLKI